VLASAQRLRRRDDFAAALRTGRGARRGALVVHVLETGDAKPTNPARVGFVVSRAVGGAVERNLVRRRLRHLTRSRLADLPAGTDVVVRALPAARLRPYRQLAADLDAALAAARSPDRR
jgi:ribonuclease P protein component